jgi:redox-sensing transcriptional repressor
LERTRVPEGVIQRLSTYLRCLTGFKREGMTVVSSQKLSMSARVNPAQIRRDLSYFGSFGRRGLGYDIDSLINVISDILGVKHVNDIALVGVGMLGRAILGYSGLKEQGFRVAYAFDNDRDKIGKNIGGVKIQGIGDIKPTVEKNKVSIGIISVPGDAAQVIADILVESGVQIILNYTPTPVAVPEEIQLHTSDPARELLHTLYYITRVSKKA